MKLPSSDILRKINIFINSEDITETVIRTKTGSPWVEFDVWVHMRGPFKFAVWIATLEIYEVDLHGAVTDDPIEHFPEGLSPRRELAI